METIRAIGMSVCITAVVTGIFSMLVPDARLEKVLKFAISLFFLTGLVTPFASGGLEFHVDLEELTAPAARQELNDAVGAQFLPLAEQQLAAGVENVLAAKGIPVKKVTVSIHIDGTERVSINRIEILLPKGAEEQAGSAAAVTRQETGIDPDVFVEE